VDLKERVPLGEFREDWSEVCRAERERRGYTQASAQITRRQDRFAGDVDLCTDPGRVLAEGDTRFRQRRAAGGAREKLNA